MNKVVLMGRLTRDPNISYTQGNNPLAVGRYTLAVDRRFKREGDNQTADFISCVVFGRANLLGWMHEILFYFIQWSDTEPYSIEELLKLPVKEGE